MHEYTPHTNAKEKKNTKKILVIPVLDKQRVPNVRWKADALKGVSQFCEFSSWFDKNETCRLKNHEHVPKHSASEWCV